MFSVEVMRILSKCNIETKSYRPSKFKEINKNLDVFCAHTYVTTLFSHTLSCTYVLANYVVNIITSNEHNCEHNKSIS